jgi:hypothetical protein
MTALVDGARICVSEKQRSEGTSFFVIPQHGGVYFEEKALHQVLGFGLVPQYRVRQAKYILPIPVEKNQKREVIAFGYLPAQFFVGERAKLVRSVKPFPEDHLSLSHAGSTSTLLLNDGARVSGRHVSSMNDPPPVRDNIQLISMR